MKLTLDELAARTREAPERLREWRDLGLIGAGDRDGDGSFDHVDAEKARLVGLFLRREIPLDAVMRWKASGGLDAYLDALFPGAGRPAFSIDEAADEARLEPELARRLWRSLNAGTEDTLLSLDDVEMLRSAAVALGVGFPEEALIQLMRVWADALGRAAEAASRLVHFHLHAGGEDPEAIGNALNPQLEPAILYFLRKGMLAAQPEDIVMHLAEEAGLTEATPVPGQMTAAAMFVDLSSFTPLAEAMGDVRAAEVLERFTRLVREATGSWGGRVVKQVGDAFLLVFHQAAAAVSCALAIELRASNEKQFPAVRSGIQWGPLLYREGDYVGSNVNVASRLANEAERHQVLVTSALRKEVGNLDDVEFLLLGPRQLKGLAEKVELYEARNASVGGAVKVRDPVCGMELGPSEVVANLSLDDRRLFFCSQDCLKLYVAAPDRYGG